VSGTNLAYFDVWRRDVSCEIWFFVGCFMVGV